MGSSASKPHEEKQTPLAKETSSSSGGCPIKRHDATAHNPARGTSSGCPVKHQEQPQQQYNVYSQPIDPTNQMPAVANQLPSPQQTQELSTERVKSTIPKVRVRAVHGSTNTDRYLQISQIRNYIPNVIGRCRGRNDMDLSVTSNVLQCFNSKAQTRRYRRIRYRYGRGFAQQYE